MVRFSVDDSRLHQRAEDSTLSGMGHRPGWTRRGVADLEDGFFGAAVAAVFSFVFALHDAEGFHDVADGMAGRGEAKHGTV